MINIAYALEITGNINSSAVAINGNVSQSALSITGNFNMSNATATRYEGPYRVTPTLSAQELNTAGKIMNENVVVEKIPEYYGLITWNGSYLRVS